MRTMWQEFSEGFVGAFKLAGALVMAVVSVAAAFTNGTLDDRTSDPHSRLHNT